MLSDFEKFIYNKHLSSFKKHQNKPYNIRKNFDDVGDTTTFYVKKLSLFFNKFKNINVEDFFNAPYSLYKDEKFFDLKFFISPKAIKTYNLYKKSSEVADPDSSEVLQKTLESIKFLKVYCRDNNLTPNNYISSLKQGKTIPDYIAHLQNHSINFYTCFGLNNFTTNIKMHYQEYRFILGDVIDQIDTMYNNFVKSKKLKILVREGIKKIC
jgi:hypothetical protein